MKNIFKTIWNSKAMDTFADVTCGIGECLLEVASELFNGSSNNDNTNYYCGFSSNDTSNEDETYEYWRNLSACEQREYFERNYKLQEYGDMYFYENTEQCAKSIADIARKENRSFTDKYDRY
jgi:hypothetical protein